MMYHNLSIIKFSLILFFLGGSKFINACDYITLKAQILASNISIDAIHKVLETTIKGKYNSTIQPLLEEIDDIQVDIAKTVVHMRTLDKEANLDDKKLLFLLNKNQSQLHTVEEK